MTFSTEPILSKDLLTRYFYLESMDFPRFRPSDDLAIILIKEENKIYSQKIPEIFRSDYEIKQYIEENLTSFREMFGNCFRRASCVWKKNLWRNWKQKIFLPDLRKNWSKF